MILRNLKSLVIAMASLEAHAHPLPQFPEEPEQPLPAPLSSEARAWYTDALPAAFHQPAWDQRDHDRFIRRLPRGRAKKDRQSIEDIFNKTAGAPMVDEARAWAMEYGVRFIVDYTCNVEGYYTRGTGVVAIARKMLRRPHKAAGVLVHEITHARQDALGLSPPNNSFFLYDNISTSFREAQATAFGKTARAEAARVMRRKNPAAHGRNLWRDFTGWYSSGGYADAYGLLTAQARGAALHVIGAGASSLNTEFKPRARRHAPVELRTLAEEFMMLDSDFAGRPWFDKNAAPDFMKKALDPRNAMRLYNREDVPDLVRRVLLAEERLLNPLPFREQVKQTLEEMTLYFAGPLLNAVSREGLPPSPSSSARPRPWR